MKIIELPGLIDLHVHLRDPGQTNKEDFYSGSSAAIAGGFTAIIDMPNNLVPITTEALLDEKISIAKQKTISDIGFNFGTLGDNFTEFPKIYDKVVGLKVYLNITTGGFIIDKYKLADIYRAWESNKPIFLHAEDDVSDLVLSVLKNNPKPTHLCHVSSKKELQFVIKAKSLGLPITCGATPHHLFLNETDKERLGAFGHMKPYLKPKEDQDFLWKNIDAIDIVESDHAPHTLSEKKSDNPPFGVPGLETTLPLMLTAEAEGKISRDQLIKKLHYNPAKIIGLKTDKNTSIKVSLEERKLSNDQIISKTGWTPFAGKNVIGKVQAVKIRGEKVFEDGKVLANPGFGKII